MGYLGGPHTTQRVHYQGEKISKHFNRAQKCSVVVKEETVGFSNDSEFGCILPTWLKELAGKMQFKAYPGLPIYRQHNDFIQRLNWHFMFCIVQFSLQKISLIRFGGLNLIILRGCKHFII